MAKEEKIPKLDYKAVRTELETNGPANLYYLWGEEDFLLRSFRDKVKKLCVGDSDTAFSVIVFDGPELDIDEFSNALMNVPFMSDRIYIELRDIDLGQIKDKEQTVFLELIKNIPETTTVCFIFGSDYKPDSRLKINKALRSVGKEIIFTPQTNSELNKWLSALLKSQKKKIRPEAASLLIERCGGKMERLRGEAEKLISYTEDDTITTQDVLAVVDSNPESDAFNIADKISKGDANGAINELYGTLSSSESPEIAAVAGLLYVYRNYYAACLVREKKADKNLYTGCGMFGFVVSRAESGAAAYSSAQVAEIIEMITDTDEKLKSSAYGMEKEVFTELVMRLCHVRKG